MNHSDLARMAGVSRQRVSQWMQSSNDFVNIGTSNLLGLCKGLDVEASLLMAEIPGVSQLTRCSTLLLWDSLYKNIGSFYGALMRWELPAVARLVEVFGLFEAEKSLGKKVWQKFESYENFIPPARRKDLQTTIKEVLSNPI